MVAEGRRFATAVDAESCSGPRNGCSLFERPKLPSLFLVPSDASPTYHSRKHGRTPLARTGILVRDQLRHKSKDSGPALSFDIIASLECMSGLACASSAEGKKQSDTMDEFHKLVDDLTDIETAISDEDQALLLITSLPSSYENFVETLLYDRDTLKLEDVLATLNSRVLQKMTKENGDGGEGLYARVRYDKRDMKQGRVSEHSKSQGRGNKLMCYICNSEEHLKRGCPKYNQKKSQDFVRNKDQVSDSRADGHESADVMIVMSVEKLLDWIMDWLIPYDIQERPHV
ncbi:retrovirus-related pol polyprotein from transposon TNT 1-94 [Tanacetum coccineum]